MSAPLWAKRDHQGEPAGSGGGHDDELRRFMAGDDVQLDRELIGFDIDATRAHVRGLARIGLLSGEDCARLEGALDELRERLDEGRFVLDERYEDGHSAIEAFLSERLGELGRRVHLGRSRNDQVLVATRLYTRAALARLACAGIDASRAALALARTHEMTPMPGYTHLQRAVPSSVGLWMGSYAEGFCDAAELLRMTSRWLDASPLGTAAGYGVNVALDREGVARELGFERVMINPMHAQASRGAHDVQALSAAWQLSQVVRRLGWDLTLFASEEFGFVRLGDEASTGSSIMPNKRNPDMAELMRTSASVVGGAVSELMQLVSLPSGYHRDLQSSKGALVRGLRSAEASARLVARVLGGLELDVDRMRGAISAGMYATDRAVELAAGGMAFRDAYRAVKASLDELGRGSPERSLHARVSPGGCARLGLDDIEARIEKLAEWA